MLQKFFSRYGTLTAADLQRIRSLTQPVHLQKGDYFIRMGSVNDRLGLVISGCLRYFYLRDGVEITGEFWQEGELCGSYESSILGQPSTLFIEALEPVELTVMSYRELKALTAEVPALQGVIIHLLEQFIVESQRRIASYITESAEQRYLRLRREMPGIEERVHQKYIASFVGVTPVTLSRIRARLAGRA